MILTADGENSISSHGIELPFESLFKVQLADRLPEDQRGQGETVRVGGDASCRVSQSYIFLCSCEQISRGYDRTPRTFHY